jgi:cold shock CspA family protein
MRYRSQVKKFLAKTGFGFLEPIRDVTHDADIIVHHREVIPHYEREYIMLYVGQRVEFDLELTAKGYRAVKVQRVH